MSKQKTMRNTGKRNYEMGSALNSMETENITDTPIYLALNMSKVVNNEESFNLMHKVGAPGMYHHCHTPGICRFYG